MNFLLEQFTHSDQFKRLADLTRRDYERYRRDVAALKTKVGRPLGELAMNRLSLPFMQRLFDAIAEKHPTKANHLLRYLRRVFAWGMTRGICNANPCKGAEQARERKQARVPTRQVLAAVTEFAKTAGAKQSREKGSCAPYLWIVIELAYLCRLRPVEALTLADANADAVGSDGTVGISTNRRKGSRDNVVEWSPRLRAAWNAAVERRTRIWSKRASPVPMRAENRLIIVSESGQPLRRSSLDSAWQTLMRTAVAEGVIAEDQRFGLHAMKHRGITDTPGTRDVKRQASGHKSDAMMDVYDHSLPGAKPSSGD